jgi:hypothetical protein
VGVTFYKHITNSDLFFARSDNKAFADRGIPSHTVSVGYLFPDYHREADHWEKLNYDNMAQVTRAVALGVLSIGNRVQRPQWNQSNPNAKRYWGSRSESSSE